MTDLESFWTAWEESKMPSIILLLALAASPALGTSVRDVSRLSRQALIDRRYARAEPRAAGR